MFKFIEVGSSKLNFNVLKTSFKQDDVTFIDRYANSALQYRGLCDLLSGSISGDMHCSFTFYYRLPVDVVLIMVNSNLFTINIFTIIQGELGNQYEGLLTGSTENFDHFIHRYCTRGSDINVMKMCLYIHSYFVTNYKLFIDFSFEDMGNGLKCIK